jgi:hypothetical protein
MGGEVARQTPQRSQFHLWPSQLFIRLFIRLLLFLPETGHEKVPTEYF